MADRVRIITHDPRAVPQDLSFPHRVQAGAASDWDDDNPPDLTILNFAPKLHTKIATLEYGRDVQIRLYGATQLRHPEVVEAVRVALDQDRDVTIRIDA